MDSDRVIFVTREGYDLPGARVRCYHFARELARHGVRADVLSYADTLGARAGEREHEMGWAERLKFNVRAFRWLARAGRTLIIISRCNYHSFAPILHHLLSRQPILLDLDDWEMRDDPAYRWGWYPTSKAHWLTRWMATRSVACIAASRHLEQLLSPWNRRVFYLPTGVDTDLFSPRHPVANGSPRYAWIGTFHHRHYVDDIRFLLNCFRTVRRRLPRAELEIVGDGLYRDRVLAAMKSLGGDHVRWRGWIAPHQMPQYLDTVHIGLYPLARTAPFTLSKSPTKLFEYMAMGKTVVASGVGEALHIVRHGENGLVASTPAEFAEAMIAAGEDRSLREKLGLKAIQTIHEDYSLSKLGGRLAGIIHQVVDEGVGS